mmetsp:Transcript_49281/g.79530  ORF Transcript_49281/g.79530 Transcript_49281/m.79530 type:complete len:274 (-) Transcript_49281:75-896(-)
MSDPEPIPIELGLAAHILSSSLSPKSLWRPRGIDSKSTWCGDSGEQLGDFDLALRDLDDSLAEVVLAGVVFTMLALGVRGVDIGDCPRDCDLLAPPSGVGAQQSNLWLVSLHAAVRGVLQRASIPLTSRPESAALCSNRSLCLFTYTGLASACVILSSASLFSRSLASSRFRRYSSVRRLNASCGPCRFCTSLTETLSMWGECVASVISLCFLSSASFFIRSMKEWCALADRSPIGTSRPGRAAASTREVSFICTLCDEVSSNAWMACRIDLS